MAKKTKKLTETVILISPPEGTWIQSTVGLYWNFHSQAKTYTVQVAFDPSFTRLFTTQNVSGISTDVSNLNTATKYWWRVQAVNGSASSEFSTPSSFATFGFTV